MGRIKWIDIAKGIGIFLVVIGHCAYIFDTTAIRVIYSFHMPLFFFLAGVVFNFEKYPNGREFIVKKFKTLLIPYYFFYLCSLAFHLLRGIGVDQTLKSLLYMLYATDELINVPLWFIPCLFVLEVGYYFLRKLAPNEGIVAGCVGACALLGWLAHRIFPIRPPFSFDIALYAVLFFYLGEKIRKIDIQHIRLWKRAVIMIVAGAVNWYINTNLLLTGVSIPNGVTFDVFLLFYAGALSGITCVVFASTLLSFDVALSFLGKNSLILQATHMIIFSVMNWGFAKLSISQIDTGSIYIDAILYTLIAIIIFLPVQFVINRFFPFAVGKELRRIKANASDEKPLL